jgi:thioesterase III
MNAKIFKQELTIKEIYLDTFGHVNNATYLTLLEDARWDLITSNGYGIDKIRSSQLGPTILEIHLKFLKELRVRERVVIQTQMTSYEKKIGKLLQKIIRNDEVCCEAEFIIGLFDTKARRLVLPTKDWLHAVGIENYSHEISE